MSEVDEEEFVLLSDRPRDERVTVFRLVRSRTAWIELTEQGPGTAIASLVGDRVPVSENPTRSWPGTTSNTPATRRRFAYDRDLFHAVAEASAAIEAPHFDRTNRSQSRGSGAATALGLADAALVADDGTLLAYTVTHADLVFVRREFLTG